MEEQALTLVGLTEDRRRLILVSDAGQRFSLPLDATLRTALRGDHARPGQLEVTMDSALRPRDIQARIRAGDSPEQVAEAARTTLEKVMGYATPVLAERAHIADSAQRASVRRRSGEGPARPLADAIAERLRGQALDPDTVRWDSWRREDGRWTLIADYTVGQSARHAEFVFDAPGRFVVANDDEARWLVGEQAATTSPQPAAPGPRRLSSVAAPGDVELPLGEDAIELVTEEPAGGTADAPANPSGANPSAAEAATSGEAGPEPEAPGDESAPRRTARKGRRAPVPSWDEIMFGGKRD